MDLVLKLREARRIRGLSQKDVARLSGVGEKTISSFETGERIDSLKISQLHSLLRVYGMSEAEFFGASLEKQIAPWELDDDEMAVGRIVEELRALPQHVQKTLCDKFQLMIDTAADVRSASEPKRTDVTRQHRADWQLLTSRN